MPGTSVSTSLVSPRRRASSRPESMSSRASKSSHLHVTDQMLIDPVIGVVHEAFLHLLELVQEAGQPRQQGECAADRREAARGPLESGRRSLHTFESFTATRFNLWQIRPTSRGS